MERANIRPIAYRLIKILDEKMERAYNDFSLSVYHNPRVDRKLSELMALSNAVAIQCKHCIQYHYVEALRSGATDDEIAQAISTAMTIHMGKCRGYATDAIMAAKGIEKKRLDE